MESVWEFGFRVLSLGIWYPNPKFDIAYTDTDVKGKQVRGQVMCLVMDCLEEKL